jgi:hypothetical protein
MALILLDLSQHLLISSVDIPEGPLNFWENSSKCPCKSSLLQSARHFSSTVPPGAGLYPHLRTLKNSKNKFTMTELLRSGAPIF